LDSIRAALDDSEQPEDQDQDQQSAETDIHGLISLFGFAGETVQGPAAFHPLRPRTERSMGIILPSSKVPDLLDFQPLTRK
jgi:hypothetical protein